MPHKNIIFSAHLDNLSKEASEIGNYILNNAQINVKYNNVHILSINGAKITTPVNLPDKLSYTFIDANTYSASKLKFEIINSCELLESFFKTYTEFIRSTITHQLSNKAFKHTYLFETLFAHGLKILKFRMNTDNLVRSDQTNPVTPVKEKICNGRLQMVYRIQGKGNSHHVQNNEGKWVKCSALVNVE